ncbi:MAG: LytTR family transcriptional regulator [Mariniphaga sp.]|nr:LytTR family transcriptional regulator [Mariniphaga sp.]
MREKNIIHKILLPEVLFIESMGDYFTIHTSERKITTRCTISSVEKVLPDDEFLRIHRSFIVSLKKISSFGPTSIFIGKKEFPIGPSFKQAVFNSLDYNGFVNS